MAITNLEEKIDRLACAVEGLVKKVEHHGVVIDEAKQIATETKEMVEAWRAAKGFGKFLKWGGGILAAVAAAASGVIAVWKGLKP